MILKKEKWNNFIIKNQGSFLQSWEWGEFQKAIGRKIWRIEDNKTKVLVIKHGLPLKKNYLYCPRGDIGNFNVFLEKVFEIAKEEKSIFLKIEPKKEINFKGINFKKDSNQIQPLKTIILNLNNSKEELLKQMHKKTRYNIRLAQRKKVITKEAGEKADVFLNLLRETAKRDNFSLHPDSYYKKMIDFFKEDGMIKVFSAEYDNKIIAANLILFFNNKAIYLHGASDYNYRNLMAPFLLQWHSITYAKNKGFDYYDFWGIDGKKWPGVTRFKKGFSGEEINYPGSYNLIFRPIWYKIYELGRKVL